MSAEKRKRSVNFSVEEKMRFLRILQKKGKVLISEVNSHDLQTNRLKKDAWIEITNELNESGSILRTTDNLKKLWQKMKTEAKAYKSLTSNQTYDKDGEPTIKIHDPVLEFVAELTGSEGNGIEFANVCETDLLDTNTLNGCSNGVPSDTQQRMPVKPAECVEVVYSAQVDEEKEVVENEQPNSKSTKTSLNNSFASERLKCDKEAISLIELQKQHMAEEHALKITHANLKTKILEAVLKKIQDEKPVDAELLNIVKNL